MGWHIFWKFFAIGIFGAGVISPYLFGTAESGAIHGSQMLPSIQGYQPLKPSLSSDSDMLQSQQGIIGPEIFTQELDHRASVQKYCSYFKSPEGIAFLIDGLQRSEPFRDFIFAYLSANRMPPELYFVVMIESSFSVNAVSHSGAAGLWQFMLNSSAYWMRHNEWLDERFDFWSSTTGALAKLKENYDEFGDWLLALAAYNAGVGRIERLLKKTHAKTFWELSDSSLLPAETREYVPRILAAAYVGSHPGRYGLPVNWNSVIQWDKVAVHGVVQISQLEQSAGIPKGVLEIGNAELRFDMTPPINRIHYLKVPHQYTQAVLDALENNALKLDCTVHSVVHGDTLYGIYKQYRTNAALVLQYNPGLTPSRLQIGQKLIIPLLPSGVSSDTGNKGNAP